jgi:hypothetical protein
MTESRTTDVEREELLEEIRAVIQDMTGMLDSLLVRAHSDARNVDLVIQNVAPVACWMDSAKLGSAVYNLLLNACQAARLGLAPRRVRVTLAEDQLLVHIRAIDNGRRVPAPFERRSFAFCKHRENQWSRSWAFDSRSHRERAWRLCRFGRVRPRADSLWFAYFEVCIRESDSKIAAVKSS